VQENTLSNAEICPKKHRSGAGLSCTASASKEKRSMDEKLGVLFSGPGPCSLPENTYSIPAICVKVVKENSTN
jgi:hypothetical protein